MEVTITKSEEMLLGKLLALAPTPELTLSYYEVLGYLYGIAITPDHISPGEWVPVIFAEDMPDYENEKQAKVMMDTLLSVLNRHIAAFHDGSLTMPFVMENLGETDFENVWEWTSGFEEALALRPEFWEEEQDISDLEQERLMYSLMVIEGVVNPEEALGMFDTIPRDELDHLGIVPSGNEMEKSLQVQLYLLQTLELAVETVQRHGALLEKQRQARLRSSAVPFAVRSSRVGKNERCPCGSTRKYKDCCGRKLSGTISVEDESNRKGSAKIIRGNFPQYHRPAPSRKPEISAGMIYQLEVSLAYTDPPVVRHLQIPAAMTLEQLHSIIQLCMGWRDRHMHQFQAGINFYGPQTADDYTDNPMRDESQYCLQDIEGELLQGVVYTYDFGDNWEHVVSLEKVIPAQEGKPYPVLIDGSMACPPEDVGGIPGYQYLLESLAYPNSEKNRELVDQPEINEYDPRHLDKDAINAQLQLLYGWKK